MGLGTIVEHHDYGTGIVIVLTGEDVIVSFHHPRSGMRRVPYLTLHICRYASKGALHARR